MHKKLRIVLFLSLLSILACEPMIGIGQNELLCLLAIILVLLGPPLYRFFRRLDDFLRHHRKDK